MSELENKLSRAAITCENQIVEPEDLHRVSSATGLTLKEVRIFRKGVYYQCIAPGQFISEAAKIAGGEADVYDLLKAFGKAEKETVIK